MTEIDKDAQTAFEAAAFRRLLEHLRAHPEVQNIGLMNLAGFCRNCLADWYRDAATEAGMSIDKAEARAFVYAMPYEEWRAKHQKPATSEALTALGRDKP